MVSRRISAVSWLAAALLLAPSALGETLRFFGSAGVESQLTPANERSPLNPDNLLDVPRHTDVGDFSLIAEASPESRVWKARVKVRGEASNRAADHLSIGAALVQYRPTKWLDVTAGRVIEKWGTGYGWTPTSFVGPARNPTDPNDRRSQNAGRDMIRADLFVKETSVSIYALRDGAVAARAYRLVGNTDVSLAWYRSAEETRGGFSLSHVFGDTLEVHTEAAHSDAATQIVAGAQYTFRNTNVVLEVYHGTDGLTRQEWKAFRELAENDLARANRAFTPLRMGRTYSFIRLSRDLAAWKTDAELIAIVSLRDGSTIARAMLSHRLRPTLNVYVMATEFAGGDQTEVDYMQVERVITVGARVHF